MKYYRKDLKAVFVDTDREASAVLEKIIAYLKRKKNPATGVFYLQ